MQSGCATYGVVPFENSTNGSVVFTLDLFADQQRKYPDIVVCGERYVEVHHCLLGHPGLPTTTTANNTHAAHNNIIQDGRRSPSSSGHATPVPSNPEPSVSRSAPLTSLSHIKKLYSHPQAWGQCKIFLSCHLKGVERQDVSSTSKAAELVAADASGTTAAISSGIAARMHKIGFLAKDIEDDANNCTRFFIIRKLNPDEVALANSAATDSIMQDVQADGLATYKSLLSFTVRDTDPGALADALAVFKRHALNLTSINPRPSGAAPWHYIFFVEFQGRKGQSEVDAALKELELVVRAWRWLGSWENALQ